jgi:DNA mismatch repair ATPase MutS
LLRVFNLEKYNSTHLRDLSSITHEAEVKITKLASLLTALDARLNFMTNIVVNGLLLYDLQCVYRLEKWREENGELLAGWLDALAEIEVTNSLSTYTFNHPHYAFPVFSETQHIKAEALGHPLLAESVCVSNNFRAGDPQSVLLITGANMAGKSTFLRTLGIAIVLAYNGAPVCAKSFSCSVMHLRTGMRTADSLKDQQSYFYAELNRLKSITEELRTKKPLLILLDEILKGTNSTDKQAGSMALVKQLIDQPCLALVATHDLALGVLEENFPQQVKNYHFEPTIENDELSFDYKLKEGIAEKMNATFLMKKMGIIPS